MGNDYVTNYEIKKKKKKSLYLSLSLSSFVFLAKKWPHHKNIISPRKKRANSYIKRLKFDK